MHKRVILVLVEAFNSIPRQRHQLTALIAPLLVEAFGSTRRRRQLNAREEGTVRVEKLGDAADALQAYMGKVVTDAEAQGNRAVCSSRRTYMGKMMTDAEARGLIKDKVVSCCALLPNRQKRGNISRFRGVRGVAKSKVGCKHAQKCIVPNEKGGSGHGRLMGTHTVRCGCDVSCSRAQTTNCNSLQGLGSINDKVGTRHEKATKGKREGTRGKSREQCGERLIKQ
eukprot:1159888-Pelagomonas_calceolata.AAC.1